MSTFSADRQELPVDLAGAASFAGPIRSKM
jgi:hypothetical protein